MPCCLSSTSSHLQNFYCQFLIHMVTCNIQTANLSSFGIDTPVQSAVPLLVTLIPRWCDTHITALTVFILLSFGTWCLSVYNVVQVNYNGTILPWSAAQRRRIGVALFPFSHINIPLLFPFLDSVALDLTICELRSKGLEDKRNHPLVSQHSSSWGILQGRLHDQCHCSVRDALHLLQTFLPFLLLIVCIEYSHGKHDITAIKTYFLSDWM